MKKSCKHFVCRSLILCSSICNLKEECSAFEFDSDSNICNLGMKDDLVISASVDSLPVYINNDFVRDTNGNEQILISTKRYYTKIKRHSMVIIDLFGYELHPIREYTIVHAII